jgi:exopolyphosphatase/guanosine-5'-triphosphate,3'-diphosphate pyrophosphatase
MQNIAVADLGTNTFTLLIVTVVDGKIKPIARKRIAVKIGKGGIYQNRISTEAIQRSIDALLLFKEICLQLSVSKIRLIGTSAFRNAINSFDVIQQIKASTGFDVEIISGNQEAQYIFKGVSFYTQKLEENYLITDIGGGSTECIIANKNKILYKESVEFGGTRLLEKIAYKDPLTQKDVDLINDLASNQFKNVFKHIETYQVKTWVGASGAFETIAQIKHQLNEENLLFNNFLVLPSTSVSLIVDEFIRSNTQQRTTHPYILPLRVEMFPVACVFIQFMQSKFQFNEMYYCGADLKEGVIAEMM